MKLQKYTVIPLGVALCLSLMACGASASTASSAPTSVASSAASEEASSVASAVASSAALEEVNSVASSAASTNGTNCLVPQEIFTVPSDGNADSMADGTYHVTFVRLIKDSGATTGAGGTEYQLTARFYAYDQYGAADVEALKEGDTIRAHIGGNDETTDYNIKTIEAEDDAVIINGGLEEGGIYLKKEDGVYRTLSTDDFPLYYEVGTVEAIPFAEEIVLNDSSADPEATAAVTAGAAAVADAISADESGAAFTCYNTTITLKNGAVVQIDRIWVP